MAAIAVVLGLAVSAPFWYPKVGAVVLDSEVHTLAQEFDSEQLVAWNKAKEGNRDAIFVLVKSLPSKSPGTNANENARKFLTWSANNGNYWAALHLGHDFREGERGIRDASKAAVWYARAYEIIDQRVRLADIEAIYALGHLYARGYHVQIDPAKARELMLTAANASPGKYAHEVAMNFEYGHGGFPIDLRQATDWYQRFGEGGTAEDARSAANSLYLLKEKIAKNGGSSQEVRAVQEKHVELLRRAAERGSACAMFELGRGMYERKEPYGGSPEVGEKWMVRSYQTGCSDASIYVASSMILRGRAKLGDESANDVMLRGWKLFLNESPRGYYSPERFLEKVRGELEWYFAHDGQKVRTNARDLTKWGAWLSTSKSGHVFGQEWMWRQLSDRQRREAIALRNQILEIAKMPTLPDRWPQPSSASSDETEPPQGSSIAKSDLADEPITPIGRGNSTIAVDNRVGSQDADVRLYLNGNLVRKFRVLAGESQEAANLPPGIYRFRYRVVVNGKPQAFEAKEPFELAEERTSKGLRATTVQVTLYKVPQGNLSMQQIPEQDF